MTIHYDNVRGYFTTSTRHKSAAANTSISSRKIPLRQAIHKKEEKNSKLNSNKSVHEDEITASGELYPISKQAKNKPCDSKGTENI